MGEKLTDKKAISIALRMAIDYEQSLIEAYTNEFTREIPEQEPGVVIARRNIAAFKRVQERYGLAPSKNIDGGKRVSVLELLRETEPQQFDAGRAALSREEGR